MQMKFYTVMFVLLLGLAHPAYAQSLADSDVSALVTQYKEHPRLAWQLVDVKPEHQPEAILTELATRGDEALQALRQVRQSVPLSAGNNPRWSLRNDVTLLTVIRRLEGRQPPLRISLSGPEAVRGYMREMPRISLKIVNDDPGGESVWFTYGGHDRGSRLSHWRIHIWDKDGMRLPVIGRHSGIGGGVRRQKELAYGESVERELALETYVRIPRPGAYKAKIYYHDSVPIADLDDEAVLSELILTESEIFDLEIAPGPVIHISLSERDYDESRKLISQLDVHQRVQMIGCDYGPEYHDYIAPESPHGKLLLMGQRAVPALLDRLAEPDINNKERAWILAIIDSIMHEPYLSPGLFDGSVGAYTCRFPGGKGSVGGSISDEMQNKLTQEWASFAFEYIRIERVQ